jgi:hypothetical protein
VLRCAAGGGDRELPFGVDLVRVYERSAVGLDDAFVGVENLGVAEWIVQVLLGQVPEGVAVLHGVDDRVCALVLRVSRHWVLGRVRRLHSSVVLFLDRIDRGNDDRSTCFDRSRDGGGRRSCGDDGGDEGGCNPTQRAVAA